MRSIDPSPPPVHRLALTPGDLAAVDPPLYSELYADPEEGFAAYVADAMRRVAWTEAELREEVRGG